MKFKVEVCRTGFGVITLEVDVKDAIEAAATATVLAGNERFPTHQTNYEVNHVINAETGLMVDFTEPVTGTIGDLIDTMPLFRNIEWDEAVWKLEASSECGQDCADVLTKGNALASVCKDVETEIMEVVVRQVNIFYFG